MYLSRTSVRTAQQRSGAHIITERKQKWRKEGVPNLTAQVTHPPVIYFLQLGLTSWSFQNFTRHAIIRSTINHMSLWIFLIFRLKQLLQIYVLYLRHTALSLQLFSKRLVFFPSSSHWTLHFQLLTSWLLCRCFPPLCQLSAKLRGLSILFQNNSWPPIVHVSLYIKPLQSTSVFIGTLLASLLFLSVLPSEVALQSLVCWEFCSISGSRHYFQAESRSLKLYLVV